MANDIFVSFLLLLGALGVHADGAPWDKVREADLGLPNNILTDTRPASLLEYADRDPSSSHPGHTEQRTNTAPLPKETTKKKKRPASSSLAPRTVQQLKALESLRHSARVRRRNVRGEEETSLSEGETGIVRGNGAARRMQGMELPSTSVRIGIVYSQASADKFYAQKTYSQLFMAAQHQAIMAGVPYDLLGESDLADVENIKRYRALLFPNFVHVKRSNYDAIFNALTLAVEVHNVGLIVAGNFMFGDEDGFDEDDGPDQKVMNDLLGIEWVDYGKADKEIDFYAADVSHPVMADYEDEEKFLSYEEEFWYELYQGYNDREATVLAVHKVDGSNDEGSAVLATETGSGGGVRNVFFSTPEIFGHSNLGWSAIQWVVYGSGTTGELPAVGIKLTRHRNLFLPRNDMDLAMYPEKDDTIKRPLLDLLRLWKEDYNFVGSYYIDIGNAPPEKVTNWEINRPIYEDYMSLGNEIGTHSYSHPYYVSNLNLTQLDYEFQESCQEIMKELALDFCGAAIPGNTESMSVNERLDNYLPYVSGEYANQDSGFAGAFGFLTPDYTMMYFSPNILFDFTLIEFYEWTASKALDKWLEQYQRLNMHASQPIVHWPWHDYGPYSDGYDLDMFVGLISSAHEDNSEFATLKDGYSRILSLQGAELFYESMLDGKLNVTVIGTGLGKMALQVQSGYYIQSVANWQAYNDTMIFLPDNGGSFEIEFGPVQLNDRPRINAMPMRANLLSLQGSETYLNFAFEGEGVVSVQVPDNYDGPLSIKGETSSNLEGSILNLNFESASLHEVEVSLEWPSDEASISPLDEVADTTFDAAPAGYIKVFLPNADAHVRGGSYEDRNYGSETGLVVKESSSKSSTRKTVMEFNLGQEAIPRTAIKAILQLYISNVQSESSQTITVLRLADVEWKEHNVTWSNLDINVDKVGSEFSVTPDSKDSWVEVDITDILQSNKLILMLEERSDDGSGDKCTIKSRESKFPPKIMVTSDIVAEPVQTVSEPVQTNVINVPVVSFNVTAADESRSNVHSGANSYVFLQSWLVASFLIVLVSIL